MPAETSPPFYHRFTQVLLGLAILATAIYLGQDIIVPLALAGLLAVLLRPVEDWLVRRGVNKILAISLALTLAVIIIVGLAAILSMQLADFADDLPKLKNNINDAYNDVRRWIQRNYNVSYRQQDQYVKKAQAQTLDTLQGTQTLGIITGPLGTLILLPIYVFLLLYYRTMLLHFIVVLFAEEHTVRVREALHEIKLIIQSYMVGLLIETGCVAALNSVGLLILGVQYAILLGVMAAILNLIPYIGGIVATVLTVIVAFINNPELSTLIGVVAVYLFVQFIDNNFLVPVIVGSKVKINALVSIVGVLIGGALAGVSGMFLSIPAIAMMKVVFDRVDGLQAWGVLLGDQTPDDEGSKLFRLPKRRRKVIPKSVDTTA